MMFIVVKKKMLKRSTRRALSPLNDSVTKNFDKEEEDDVINHGRKSHTHQNPLHDTW
jgi:hypothetical protein